MKGLQKRLISAVAVAAMTLNLFGVMPASAMSGPLTGNPEKALEVAEEGIVLLQNDEYNGEKALPLPKGETVALFGRGIVKTVKGGGGSGSMSSTYVVSIQNGLEKKEEEGKISIYQELEDTYTSYYKTATTVQEMELTDELVAGAAENADTAIIALSRSERENADNTVDPDTKNYQIYSYNLSDLEKDMLDKVTSAGFEHVVVLINSSWFFDTSWIDTYNDDTHHIDAVVNVSMPGIEGGNAVANMLCGDVNPSGKLVDTVAKSFDDYPSQMETGDTTYTVHYEEDIFNGYRYFETFDPEYEKVRYEFGYGLSYTDFDISNVKVSFANDKVTVNADVTNTGSVAGKEVVQVYFSAPQMNTGTAKLSKPAKELAAFVKTKLLEPDETETVTAVYDIADMSSYDDTGVTGNKSAYVMEAGDYNIYVGNSIKNAGENGIRDTYTVEEDTVTEQLTQRLKPKNLFRRLLADGTYENMVENRHTISLEKETTIASNAYFKVTGLSEDDFVQNDDGETYYPSFSKGMILTYVIDVAETGDYSVSMKYAAGTARTNHLKLYLDDDTTSITGISSDKTYTSGEEPVFKESRKVTMHLEKGTHYLMATTDNYLLDLVSIKFGPVVDETIHIGKDLGRVVIEAENATNSSSASMFEVSHASGGSCIQNVQKGTSYIYELTVEEAGEYKIDVTGGLDNEKEEIIAVTPIFAVSLSTDNTNFIKETDIGSHRAGLSTAEDYPVLTTGEQGEITLDAGRVYLKLERNGAAFPYFFDTLSLTWDREQDYVEPVEPPVIPEGPFAVSATETTRVEAEGYSACYTGTNEVVQTVLETASNRMYLANFTSLKWCANNYVEYEVVAEKAGDYIIDAAVAGSYLSWAYSYADSLEVSVGAEAAGNMTVATVLKDGAGMELTGTPVTVTLAEGTNTIKFRNVYTGHNTLAFDYFEITPAVADGEEQESAQTALFASQLFDEDDYTEEAFLLRSDAADEESDYDAVTVDEASENPNENTSYLYAEKHENPEDAYVKDDSLIMLWDVYEDPSLMDAFLNQMNTRQLVQLLGGKQSSIPATGSIGLLPKFGIPGAETADGPQGVVAGFGGTAWPCGVMCAQTWNTDLIYEMGKGFGAEAASDRIDVMLAPGMNIHRYVLCGRNFEYYSEDPLIAGKMAAAMTRGMQSENVSVALKHFAANNLETQRSFTNSILSERALREIYLKGFEIAVKEAQPWGIMGSYNLINNTEASESYDLNTAILRGEWKYDGCVMTDWGNNSKQPAEILAGTDLKMPSGDYDGTMEALENGTITIDDVKECAKNVLWLVMRTNQFQQAYVNAKHHTVSAEETTHISAMDYGWNSGYLTAAESDDTESEEKQYPAGTEISYTFMTYTLDVEKDGYYRLDTRIKSSKPTDGRQQTVKTTLDNSAGEYISFSTAELDGQWRTKSTIIKLTAGTHVLGFDFNRPNFNINWIELTPVDEKPSYVVEVTKEGTYTNPSTGEKTGENRLRGGEYSAATKNARVDGYADAQDGRNVTNLKALSVLKYDVDVKDAGTYMLQVNRGTRYGGMSYNVLVDGVWQNFEKLLDVTGGEYAYKTSEGMPILLPEGEHTIEIYFTFAENLNISHFNLVYCDDAIVNPVVGEKKKSVYGTATYTVVKTDICSNSEEQKEATVVVAAYKEGQLVGIVTDDVVLPSINENHTNAVGRIIDIDAFEEYDELKVMVLDSLEGIKPLGASKAPTETSSTIE